MSEFNEFPDLIISLELRIAFNNARKEFYKKQQLLGNELGKWKVGDDIEKITSKIGEVQHSLDVLNDVLVIYPKILP